MIDPKNKVDRILMFLPGAMSWSLILLPLWLGYLAPRLATFVLTFVAIYWVFMSYKHGITLLKGYKAYKEESAIDWYKRVKEIDFEKLPNKETLPKTFDELRHFILIPTYKEGIDILEPTFVALMNQSFPSEKFLIVIGTEEIGADSVKKVLETLKDKYGNKFPEFMQFIHPKGIPDEIEGVASPNRTWAAKHAVKYLKDQGKDIKNFIFTTFDSDTILHKEFIARVTYLYLEDENRFNRFYQTSAQFFDNNIWDVPVLSRIESNLVTFGLLSTWDRETRFAETYSCYSCALDTVVTADYWDVRFIDDTVFFWRAFIAREGDFTPKYFRVPISADATGGPNYVAAHKNLYKQLVRWGWGSVGTVIALKTIYSKNKTKKTSLEKKLLWTYLKIERHTLQRTAAFLMMFGFTMLTFVNQQFKHSSTVYGLPQVISIFLTGALLMFIPLTIVKRKIYPLPKDMPLHKKIFHMVEGPILVINLVTYSFIPWMYAETMMMFGKLPKKTFYTPKTR